MPSMPSIAAALTVEATTSSRAPSAGCTCPVQRVNVRPKAVMSAIASAGVTHSVLTVIVLPLSEQQLADGPLVSPGQSTQEPSQRGSPFVAGTKEGVHLIGRVLGALAGHGVAIDP